MIPWRGLGVWWSSGTLPDMLSLKWTWGPFWNDLLLAAHGGGGVKFAHDIQDMRLSLKRRVAFAWTFICMMMRWPSKVLFIVTYLPWILISIINLTRPYALDFVIGGSATFAKEELRSIFGYWSKAEKHFTSIGGYAMMFSPPRPLMHSHETGGYSIPKLALAIWGKCTNKTTYFCGDNPN